MKIKNQFRLFILGIIAVPIICFIAIPVYHYMTGPERILLNGYQQVRNMSSLPISERDWNIMKDVLKSYPPEIEVAIVANHSEILLSTIPELKGMKAIDDPLLFSFIKSTSHDYFYQVVSPPLEDHSVEVLFISRVSREHDNRPRRTDRWLFTLLGITALFEAFSISVIVHISSTISKSITLLEKNTQRIADGELSVELEVPGSSNSSNEITSLTENLDKMRCAIKDEQERRTRFIMGISHDLRTPVAVIKGYTEALSDSIITDPAQMQNALELISTKTNQLETMIDTLINFVKLDSKDWREQLVSQPLLPVITEFADAAVMTGTVFKRQVTSSITIAPDRMIPFDKQLLQRALENIFSNALRYTTEGDSITICAAEADKNISITIEDGGCGIDAKDKEHIFDLFYRGTNSRREPGMGIGLAVVKNIIDTHGWFVNVKSQKGIGTSFIITIPFNIEIEKK
jgi:signal transduction histidine kinase